MKIITCLTLSVLFIPVLSVFVRESPEPPSQPTTVLPVTSTVSPLNVTVTPVTSLSVREDTSLAVAISILDIITGINQAIRALFISSMFYVFISDILSWLLAAVAGTKATDLMILPILLPILKRNVYLFPTVAAQSFLGSVGGP